MDKVREGRIVSAVSFLVYLHPGRTGTLSSYPSMARKINRIRSAAKVLS